jgi:hypothetical protein
MFYIIPTFVSLWYIAAMMAGINNFCIYRQHILCSTAFSGTGSSNTNGAPVASHTSSEGTMLGHKSTEAQSMFCGKQDGS